MTNKRIDSSWLFAAALFALLILFVLTSCRPQPAPTPTATATATATAESTRRPTVTATAPPTVPPTPATSPTVAPSATNQPTATSTPQKTPTAAPTPSYSVTAAGWASAYAPGVFIAEVTYKIAAGWLATPDQPFDGYIATTDCAAKGGYLLARAGPGAPVERLFIGSCAGRDAHGWMIANNIIGEVDYATWQRWQPYRTPRGMPLEFLSLN